MTYVPFRNVIRLVHGRPRKPPVLVVATLPEHFEHCGRCDGEGGIDAYSHVCGGICFVCYGAGERPRAGYRWSDAEIERHVRLRKRYAEANA